MIVYRSKPLQIWDRHVRNGHIKRLTDADIQSSVLEIMGTNVSTNFITCPVDNNKTLAIKLPFLVMIIKNVSGCCHRDIGLTLRFCLHIVEEVFHFRSAGTRWQERPSSFQSLQLSVYHSCQAIHLHHANETRWGMESDSVQLVWFHQKSLRYQLYWDPQVSIQTVSSSSCNDLTSILIWIADV